MEACLRSRNASCDTIWLGVWRRTGGIAFYEKWGFQRSVLTTSFWATNSDGLAHATIGRRLLRPSWTTRSGTPPAGPQIRRPYRPPDDPEGQRRFFEETRTGSLAKRYRI
jgi:hypothetical protein